MGLRAENSSGTWFGTAAGTRNVMRHRHELLDTLQRQRQEVAAAAATLRIQSGFASGISRGRNRCRPMKARISSPGLHVPSMRVISLAASGSKLKPMSSADPWPPRSESKLNGNPPPRTLFQSVDSNGRINLAQAGVHRRGDVKHRLLAGPCLETRTAGILVAKPVDSQFDRETEKRPALRGAAYQVSSFSSSSPAFSRSFFDIFDSSSSLEH